MAKYILIVWLLLPCALVAQNYSGKVVDQNKTPLIGANVYWSNSSKGVSTDNNGRFVIDSKGIENKILVISFVGYNSDTIEVTSEKILKIQLNENKTLEEINVSGKRDGIIISSLKPIKTEQITSVELTKAACCDLAGCFNTQASVEPTTTNVVTNAKELRILGLSGVYNQVLVDGMPMIQGLSYTYGVSAIPGTLVDNIFVAKGANSVLQGYESISGQINVELKDPDKAEKLFLNAYVNSYLEKQFNANYTHKFKKWRTALAIHSTQPANKIDKDDDTFLDLPLLTRYSVYNKWKMGNKNEWGWHSLVGIRYVNENRIGGQLSFNPGIDKGTTQNYGQTMENEHFEYYSKSGFRMNNNHHFALNTSAFYNNQHSYFGTTKYAGNQKHTYLNLQHELSYKMAHSLKSGLSLRYVNISENIDFSGNILNRTYNGEYIKDELIPGVFVENIFNWYNNKLQLITGIRVDSHNKYGEFITPRSLLKWNNSKNGTLRISAGKGWRTTNLFSENLNLLASSRDIIIEEQLNPEEAINFGLNYTHKINLSFIESMLSVDFYRTQFQNQIFPDYDTDPTKAFVKNYKGKSISNGFQAELGFEFIERIGFKIAYNYLDVFREENDFKKVLPFNPKDRVKSSFSFKPLKGKWHFDMNYHWYGKQKLTNTNTIESLSESDPYNLLNCQLSKTWNNFDVYIGCENVFDFRQDKPIVGWQNPFGPDFDTSSVWGPTRGREIYLGLRFVIQ